MNCYAWNIPLGCYDAAEDANGVGCGTPWWFWLAVAAAGAAVVLGKGRKQNPHRMGRRVVTARRKR